MHLSFRPIALILAVFFLLPAFSAVGAEINVHAVLERQDAFVGEAVSMQIQVDGHNSPPEPDLSTIAEFTVTFRGGQQNSSTSITSINGKWSKVSRHGYIFNYLLTPKRAGQLTVPPINLSIDGKIYTTRPLALFAREPEETDDFKLRLHLNQQKCYVGEPVTLTTTWYIGKDVRNFEFSQPLLDDPRFEVVPSPTSQATGQQDEFEISLGDSSVIGRRSRGELDGHSYTTLTFEQIVIPRQSGELTIPKATVACQALSGYSQSRRNFPGPFGNEAFFDDFFNQGRQKVYKTVITPSNEPRLTVMELPETGRPDNFNGPVGEFTITAQAAPTEVNVGDPITLTISVNGSFVDRVKLPDLAHLADKGFKIPEENSPGESHGPTKTFVQTIRAANDRISEIPAIHFSYFNPRANKYETAVTTPIDLSVRPTRIITASDAEGGSQVVKSKIKSLEEGINFNYDDSSVLVSHKTGTAFSSSVRLVLAAPPAFFMFLFLSTLLRRRKKDPETIMARKAFSELDKTLSALAEQGEITTLAMAFQTYLGRKLQRPPGALTFMDVEHLLKKMGVDRDTLITLEEIFNQCEEHRYSGGTTPGETLRGLIQKIRTVAEQLEKKLS